MNCKVCGKEVKLHEYTLNHKMHKKCFVNYSIIELKQQIKDLLKKSAIEESRFDDSIHSAINLAKKMHMMDSNDAEIINIYGIVAHATGNKKLAQELFDEGLELYPTNATLLNNKGLSLYLTVKYRDSIPYFNKALHIEPKLNLANINRNNAIVNLKDKKYYREEYGITDYFDYIVNQIPKNQKNLRDCYLIFFALFPDMIQIKMIPKYSEKNGWII